MKMPKGQGLWPAFWMLGSNIDSDAVSYTHLIGLLHLNEVVIGRGHRSLQE